MIFRTASGWGGVGVGAYRYHGYCQGILGNLGALCIFQPFCYPISACIFISNRKSNLLRLLADFNETLITRDRAIFFLLIQCFYLERNNSAKEATVLGLAEFLFKREMKNDIFRNNQLF